MSNNKIKSLLNPPSWIRWLVSIGLIAILLWISDITAVITVVSNSNIYWLIVGLFLAMCLTAFGAFKWWVLMPRNRSSIFTFIRVNFLSNFIGIFLPGIVGIEAARVAGITRSSGDLPAALASVLVDRFFGLLSLAAMVAVGGIISASLIPQSIVVISGISLILLLICVAVMMHSKSRKAIASILPVLLAPGFAKLIECFDLYKARPLTLLLSFWLSLMLQFGRVILTWFIVQSLSLDVALDYLFIVVPVAFFVQMLPITIYGIGIRESAMVSLLTLIGVSTEAALSASLLLFAIQIVSSFPGGLIMATGGGLNGTPPQDHSGS